MTVHNYPKLLLTTLVIFGYSSNIHSSEIANINSISTNDTILPTINDLINSNYTDPNDIKNFHSNDIYENIQKK